MFLRMSAAKAVRWADGWTFDVNVWNHLGNKAVAPASICNHAQSGYQVLFRRCNQRGEKRSYPCGHHFGGERNNCFAIQADGVHVLTAITIYLEINEARGKPGVIPSLPFSIARMIPFSTRTASDCPSWGFLPVNTCDCFTPRPSYPADATALQAGLPLPLTVESWRESLNCPSCSARSTLPGLAKSKWRE